MYCAEMTLDQLAHLQGMDSPAHARHAGATSRVQVAKSETASSLPEARAVTEYPWCAAVLGSFLLPLRPSTALCPRGDRDRPPHD